MGSCAHIWRIASFKLMEMFGTREGFQICPQQFCPHLNLSSRGSLDTPHAQGRCRQSVWPKQVAAVVVEGRAEGIHERLWTVVEGCGGLCWRHRTTKRCQDPPPPACPTNAVSNEHFRSDRIC